VAERGKGPAAPGTELPEEDWAALPRPEALPEPDLGAAVERARRELEEDRGLAETVARREAEEAYLDDLRRLTLSLRQAREPAPEIAIEDYQEAVRKAGEQIARLEAQHHALRPNAETDRFYYTPAQIRRRAELYEQAGAELE